jgi:APA family basic amino acid/polyamine antiporter
MTTATPLEIGTPTIPASDQLPRRLGFWATTAVVVGTIIGSGIFRVPATVAAEVGSPAAIMLVWVLGGVISLSGALALAELAAALPQLGGVFVYLRQAYGPLVAFLFGWTQLFLAPASIGGIALVFAEYLSTVVSLSPFAVRGVAALLILLVGVSAYRSVSRLGAFLSVAAVAKVAAIATLVLAAFLLGDGNSGSLGRGAPPADSVRVGLALVAALWAYNGIHDMVCVAGEVKDAGRVLPRALVAGVAGEKP